MLISNAYAQTAAAGGAENQLLGFLPIILMFVVMYFLMIRPQMKRAKEHRNMLAALQKGDEVITAGGIVGRVAKVGEAYVTVEVSASGEKPVEMNFQKSSVQTLLPKGTIKAI
ncbi:MAG: preprotein translocase subunit YajC [Lautropia sp.]|nr:preprotein translocase subunit YajC [Lautropia sp.]